MGLFVGDIMSAFNYYWQNKLKIPLNLLEAPIPSTPHALNRSLLKSWSSILLENSSRLRTMSGRSTSTHVSELLGPAEYSLYYKDLVRFKISEPSDILNAQQTDTLSFTYFITRFDN